MISQTFGGKSLKQLMRLKYAFVITIFSDGNVQIKKFVNCNDAFAEYVELKEKMQDRIGKDIILVYLSQYMEYVEPSDKYFEVNKLIDLLLNLFS